MKILRPGKKEFTTKCDTCGCLFTYCLQDIHFSSVICPECGRYVAHRPPCDEADGRENPYTRERQDG